jgi:hypothetical protein
MEVIMSRTGSFSLRTLGVLILVGALLAGGVLLFQAGRAGPAGLYRNGVRDWLPV